MKFRPKVRNNEILVQELGNELLIYDLQINKAFSLNETCAMVWQECDGEKTILEIASILSKQTNGLVNEEIVWLALKTLQREDLLAKEVHIPLTFNGLSRRQVIRKVGFTSFVVLPAISFLIAPESSAAASGVCKNFNETCIFLSDSSQSNCCSALRCIFNSTCIPCGSTNSLLSTSGNIFSAAACTTLCQSQPGSAFCCNTTSPVRSVYTSFANQCDCRCP